MVKPTTTPAAPLTFAQIRATLALHRASLAARYHLRELGVFGSYVRGEQRPGSDVDILVAFDRVPSMFTLIALEDELHELLGLPIDIAVKSALRPHIGAQILREVIAI